jgi:type I restriction enzyme S subunit
LRDVAYLTVANVQDKSLHLQNVKHIAATESEIERLRLQVDDLLLTEGGDPDKLGRGALWSGEIAECIHQNHVFRVRVTRSDLLDPIYLSWLVGSSYGKSYFLKAAKQTTGIASINATQLRSFPVLLPMLSIQTRFRAVLSKVAEARRQFDSHLTNLDELFASLQSRAFKGEL